MPLLRAFLLRGRTVPLRRRQAAAPATGATTGRTTAGNVHVAGSPATGRHAPDTRASGFVQRGRCSEPLAGRDKQFRTRLRGCPRKEKRGVDLISDALPFDLKELLPPQVCANLSRIMSAKSLWLASDDSTTFRKSSQSMASNSTSVLARIEAFRRASVMSPISPK